MHPATHNAHWPQWVPKTTNPSIFWTILGHRLLNSTLRNFVWDHRNPKERTLPTSWASSLGRCSNHLQADREPDESSPRCPVFSAARRGQTDLHMSCGLWGKFPTKFANSIWLERWNVITSWRKGQRNCKLIGLQNYTLTPLPMGNTWAFAN